MMTETKSYKLIEHPLQPGDNPRNADVAGRLLAFLENQLSDGYELVGTLPVGPYWIFRKERSAPTPKRSSSRKSRGSKKAD